MVSRTMRDRQDEFHPTARTARQYQPSLVVIETVVTGISKALNRSNDGSKS